MNKASAWVMIPKLNKNTMECTIEMHALVLCKDCKYCEYPDSDKEWCKKGHLHGNTAAWFCADGEKVVERE